MAQNIFILGAGASYDAGAPLMYDFLDKSERLLLTNDKYKEDLQKVLEARVTLHGVYSKSHLDLDNLEVFFGTLEMANLLKHFGNYNETEIKKFREALVNVIVGTLEHSIKFKKLHVPKPYDGFADLIKKLNSVAVITFNYDICIDYAFTHYDIPFQYCLSDLLPDSIRLLKLHGSINWGECDNCQFIEPFPIKLFHSSLDREQIFHATYKDLLGRERHGKCGGSYKNIPVIVPPTWNKTQYNGQLINVWRQAAKELSEAENIFVIGYSLPETDQFFRYLFALGTLGDSRIKRFWVFDPKSEIEGRYRSLIGRGIERRFKFEAKNFYEAILNHIGKELEML